MVSRATVLTLARLWFYAISAFYLYWAVHNVELTTHLQLFSSGH